MAHLFFFPIYCPHPLPSSIPLHPTSIFKPCGSYFCPEKNHELLLFGLHPDASFCKPEITGMGASPPPPPPLSGFAILLPATPKLNPPGPVGEPRPRVLPDLAASRRSFTAASWASNLLMCQSTILG